MIYLRYVLILVLIIIVGEINAQDYKLLEQEKSLYSIGDSIEALKIREFRLFNDSLFYAQKLLIDLINAVEVKLQDKDYYSAFPLTTFLINADEPRAWQVIFDNAGLHPFVNGTEIIDIMTKRMSYPILMGLKRMDLAHELNFGEYLVQSNVYQNNELLNEAQLRIVRKVLPNVEYKYKKVRHPDDYVHSVIRKNINYLNQQLSLNPNDKQ